MKLNPIQTLILTVQLIGIAFNFYAIYVKKVADSGGHIFAIFILLTIMTLSFISWKQTNTQKP
ncbi:hypothetical protein [Desulfosporosinus lacus]|uniref:hypothetical protein n=1 Tax=Desulfosporosinus lacus TaxID=329936 RepID=UPI0009331688|nr:hypothetical protein [Desulfosporosinus lacus]